MTIEITKVLPEEDWYIVTVNGEEVHSGHEIPDFVWMELLARAGVTTKVSTANAHDLGVCGADCPDCEPLTEADDFGIV